MLFSYDSQAFLELVLTVYERFASQGKTRKGKTTLKVSRDLTHLLILIVLKKKFPNFSWLEGLLWSYSNMKLGIRFLI